MFRFFLNKLVYGPAKHLCKLITSSEYRKYCILKLRVDTIPRYTKCKIKINGMDLVLPDYTSFFYAYKEIFVNRIYEFNTNRLNPYILDVGANVGVSVLFFKTLFPSSEIIAFEADPKIYEYLINNVHGNGFDDITIINKAVWYEKTWLKFKSEGADAGRITSEVNTNTIDVESIDLKEFLNNRKVDFLKMDIEGAETDVLLNCSQYLGGVENIFIEYHSVAGEPQRLDQLLGVLKQNGFRYHMHSGFNKKMPYLNKLSSFYGYDMLLNIFAWRENQ